MAEQDSQTPAGSDLAEEMERLRAENEALRAQLETAPEAGSSSVFRRVVSWVLVALAVIAVVVGVHAVWLQTTISDEDRFVDTLAPLPKDPAVATAISERLADELIEATGVRTVIEEALPSDLSFLAVPVTEGVRDLTASVAGEVIRSDAFSGIWQASLRLTHVGASAVLSTGGNVTLDLNEAADAVVAGLEGRDVTLLSGRQTDLPEIVVFQNDQLEQAAGVLEAVETLGWFVPALALVLIVAAVWVSPMRRRTASVLGFGSAIAALAVLAVVRVVQAGSTDDPADPTGSAAADAVWETLLRFYRQAMWALIVLGIVVGSAAWVMGPSPRAERVRAAWEQMIRRWQGEDAVAPTSGFAGFVADWRRPIQWGVVVLALLFLVLGPDASGLLVLITALVVLVVVAIVEVVGGPARAAADAADEGVADRDSETADV